MKNVLFCVFTLISTCAFAQVTLINDYQTGTDGIAITEMNAGSDKLLFRANPDESQNEVFVFDGANLTYVDINETGSNSSDASGFVTFNNEVYFCATDGSGYNIYKIDDDLHAEVNMGNWDWQNPVAHNNNVFFTYKTGSDPDQKIYSWDGTTKNLLDNQSNIIGTGNFIPFGDVFLISGNLTDDNPDMGNELLLYDPNSGATLLKDLVSGSGNAVIKEFIRVDNLVYFIDGNNKLWQTDGTSDGTARVETVNNVIRGNQNFGNLYNWNGNVYCLGCNDTDESQLYVYDPDSDTFSRITDYITYPIPGFSSPHYFEPHDFVALGDFLYFSASDPDDAGNYKLFKVSASNAVELVDDLIYDVDHLTVFKNVLYMQGNDGDTGYELYQFDPLLSETQKISNGEGFELYPNPTKDILYVRGMSEANARYEIFDLEGKLIESGEAKDNTIKHDLSKGIYIVHLHTSNEIYKQKVVVM